MPWKSLSEAQDKLEALWLLKSLALPDLLNQGVRADISMASVKSLARLGLKLTRQSVHTREWLFYHLSPHKIPHQLPIEWAGVAKELGEYFASLPFTPIERDLLAWSIRKLAPAGHLWEFSSDLVRTSQRLAPSGKLYNGLHPAFLINITKALEPFAQQLVESAPVFVDCKELALDCSVSLRKALKDPLLSPLALKGPRFSWLVNQKEWANTKALDWPILWRNIVERLAKREFTRLIFNTFARKGNGIPIDGGPVEEIKEAMDLAHSFLRFAALGNGVSREGKNEENKEEQISISIIVRPSSLHRALGLIGDQWFSDGNGDGILNQDEFFSSVQVFSEIQQNATDAVMSYFDRVERPTYFALSNLDVHGIPYDFSQTLYQRDQFIRTLGQDFSMVFPEMGRALESLGDEKRNSFFHSLVSADRKTPLEVAIPFEEHPKALMLDNYVDAKEALASSAIFTVLDKLMIRCDLDENMELNWKEMDCGIPLMLKAGQEVVGSGLVDLYPGVNDLSRILLHFLQKPGIPLMIAKVLVANGSLTEFNLSDELFQWAKSEIIAGNFQISKIHSLLTLSGSRQRAVLPTKKEIMENLSRHRGGSLNQDKDEADGVQFKAFKGFLVSDIRNWVENEHPNISLPVAKRFMALAENDVFNRAIQLAILSPESIEALLSRVPFRTNPAKILSLLEELIHREIPFGQER